MVVPSVMLAGKHALFIGVSRYDARGGRSRQLGFQSELEPAAVFKRQCTWTSSEGTSTSMTLVYYLSTHITRDLHLVYLETPFHNLILHRSCICQPLNLAKSLSTSFSREYE
ncbi:unnamed protein product [Caretta caretta]